MTKTLKRRGFLKATLAATAGGALALSLEEQALAAADASKPSEAASEASAGLLPTGKIHDRVEFGAAHLVIVTQRGVRGIHKFAESLVIPGFDGLGGLQSAGDLADDVPGAHQLLTCEPTCGVGLSEHLSVNIAQRHNTQPLGGGVALLAPPTDFAAAKIASSMRFGSTRPQFLRTSLR